MKVKPFSGQGKYTIFDNIILDQIMPTLKPNSWKVLCLIIRKTRGWNKEWDTLSFNQIKTGTGIKNNSTLSGAIRQLEKERFIIVHRCGELQDANKYSLNTGLEIEIISTVGTENVPNNDVIDTEIVPDDKPIGTETVPSVGTEIVPTKASIGTEIVHTKHSLNTINTNNGKSGDLPSINKTPIKPKTELYNYFLAYTKIPGPTNKSEEKYWWLNIGIIYTLAAQDIDAGKRLIRQSVDKLKDDDLTISDPGSLIKTIRALIANGACSKIKLRAI